LKEKKTKPRSQEKKKNVPPEQEENIYLFAEEWFLRNGEWGGGNSDVFKMGTNRRKPPMKPPNTRRGSLKGGLVFLWLTGKTMKTAETSLGKGTGEDKAKDGTS